MIDETIPFPAAEAGEPDKKPRRRPRGGRRHKNRLAVHDDTHVGADAPAGPAPAPVFVPMAQTSSPSGPSPAP
ncbi:MAG: hypothetical protein ACRD00_08725, partial [Thermoanaerobaculia bacterium]